MMKEVRFGYGVMVETLEEQAEKQGYTLGDRAETLEKIRYSINMVGFHVATETQVNQMFKKLNKKVISVLKKSEEV